MRSRMPLTLWAGRLSSTTTSPGLRSGTSGLASLQWRAFGGLCGPPFELHRAEEVERGVAPDGVVDSIDVTADGVCSLGPGLEDGAPDELGFQRLEERLHHGIVETVAPARPGNPEAVRPELGLIRRRAILAASVGVVDQPGGRASPGAGRRRASALRSAVSAKSVWRRSLTAPPTTRRAHRSMTTARYSQPSRVQM